MKTDIATKPEVLLHMHKTLKQLNLFEEIHRNKLECEENIIEEILEMSQQFSKNSSASTASSSMCSINYPTESPIPKLISCLNGSHIS